jgi:hypothetical protein
MLRSAGLAYADRHREGLAHLRLKILWSLEIFMAAVPKAPPDHAVAALSPRKPPPLAQAIASEWWLFAPRHVFQMDCCRLGVRSVAIRNQSEPTTCRQCSRASR